MRATRVATLAVSLALFAPMARAGVYHPEEPGRPAQLVNFQQLRLRLGELRQIAADPGPGRPVPPARAAILEQVERLLAKEKREPLTVADRCNLGACYLRLAQPTDAIAALKPTERATDDPSQFLALSTLATAYQDAGDLDSAEVYLQQALRSWPTVYAHWSPAQLAWFRRCDRLQLALVRARRQEQRAGLTRANESLDAIFPGVSFTTASGEYVPGEISMESRDNLPPEAVHLTAQLVYWLPHDNRLYWLLGETLNANGQVSEAYEVVRELVDARGFSPRELREHRKVLLEAREAAREWQDNGNRNLRRLMLALAPRGVGLAPGASAFLPEAGWAATLGPMEQSQGQSWIPVTAQPAPSPNRGLPDWKTVTVSAIFGALAALILQQQFRRPPARPVPTTTSGIG